jgi:endonuclease/exonuclease/phosphatase family metal-dependent hydrolase
MTRFTLSWLAVCIAAVGCSDSSSGGGDAAMDGGGDGDAAGPVSSLSMATFNTGLVGVVKGVDARRVEIESALVASDIDVLCLQELFKPIVIADFAAGVSEAYPHSFHSELGDSAVGNGLLILSRYPLEGGQEMLFTATDPLGLTDRMVIAADVVLGDQRLHVMCSHLQAGLDAESTDVRTMQVDEIVAFADEQGYLAGPSVLLGDFNMGPDPVESCTVDDDPPCLAPDVATYDKVLQTFDDGAADSTACTQCRDIFLPLQVLSSYIDEPDQRIDHCFTRSLGDWAVSDHSIVFDEAVDIPYTAADGTTETLVTLSDHVGVRCDLEYAR